MSCNPRTGTRALLSQWIRIVIVGYAAMLANSTNCVAASDNIFSVDITVTDAASKRPVRFATVFLIGPTAVSGITDERGRVLMTPLQRGSYTGKISKSGYIPTSVRHIEVGSAEELSVAATLSQTLKTIGSVIVKSARSLSASSVTDNSAGRVVSGSLVSALDLDPTISLGIGQGNASTVSINGHSPSETAIYVDGAPLSPLGVSTNTRALNSGLFDSVAVSSSSAASFGGTAQFHVPDPTLAPSVSFDVRYEQFDRSSISIFGRGTIGNIGLSLGHSTQGYNDVLNGRMFLDTSGLDYRHDAAATTISDVFKVRVPLNPTNVLTGLVLSSRFGQDDYCKNFSALLPCGFGPGNFTRQNLQTFQIRDTTIVGRTSIDLTLFTTRQAIHDFEGNRLSDGAPIPFIADAIVKTQGLSFTATRAAGKRHNFGIKFLSLNTGVSGGPSTDGTSAPAQQSSLQTMMLSDTIKMSRTTTLQAQIGFAKSSGSLWSPSAEAGIVWAPTDRDRLAASYSGGNRQPDPFVATGFTIPQQLRFDCSAKLAFGAGPTLGSAAQDSSSAQLSWSHRFGLSQVSVSFHRDIVHGDVLQADIPGSAFDGSAFPPTYFSEVSALFGSPVGCGTPGTVTPDRVNFSSSLVGSAKYEGGNLLARVALGHGLIAMPYYGTTVASAIGNAVHIPIGSTVLPGLQLPHVPLHKRGITLDWKSPGSAIESILNIQQTSANNPNNLPAYTTVALGTALKLQQGQLIISISNLFNQDAGLFASPQNMQPLPRYKAPPLSTLTQPLEPRIFRVEYRATVGLPYQQLGNPQSENLAEQTSTSFSLAPFPTTAPANAFEIASDNSTCGPESVAVAKPVLETLARYVASGSFVASKDLTNGAFAALRRGINGYTLLIGSSRKSVINALFSCASLHGGSDNDVRARGLYAPSLTESEKFDILFYPTVGLYVTGIISAAPQKILFKPLPRLPPRDPFSPLANAQCPVSVRAPAGLVLNELKDYFHDMQIAVKPTTPRELQIAEYHSPKTWFGIRFADAQLQSAILQCANIASGNAEDLRKLGVNGLDLPALNYAASLGLYTLER